MSRVDQIKSFPLPLSEEHRKVVCQLMLENLEVQATAFIEWRNEFRVKPLLGDEFGLGRFSIASWWDVRKGLDVVRYFVLDEKSWFFIGSGDSKAEALADAREVLQLLTPQAVARYVGGLETRRIADEKVARQAAQVAWDARRAKFAMNPVARVIPKRRRAIFEAADGKCHYCGTTLTLDGRWHIEHKMPRALLGGSEQHNLVASCVTCNLKKSDKTDLEFKARITESLASN